MVYVQHSEFPSRGIEPHRQAAIPPPPAPRIGESRANLVEDFCRQIARILALFGVWRFLPTKQTSARLSQGQLFQRSQITISGQLIK